MIKRMSLFLKIWQRLLTTEKVWNIRENLVLNLMFSWVKFKKEERKPNQTKQSSPRLSSKRKWL